MDINYELYKVFYHVATTLSFSEASKQLFISQSAVSQSIKAVSYTHLYAFTHRAPDLLRHRGHAPHRRFLRSGR